MLRVFLVLLVVAGITAGFVALRAVPSPALEDVLANARQAVLGANPVPDERPIRLAGPATLLGQQGARGELSFQNGRFRSEFAGHISQAFGHDGEHTWEQNPAGNVRRLSEGNANFQRLIHWFITGHWLLPEYDLGITLDERASTRDDIAIQVDAGGGVAGVAFIDRRSSLPSRLELRQFGRDQVLEIAWGNSIGERVLPSRVLVTDGGTRNVEWNISEVEVLEDGLSFAQPPDATQVEFDPSIEPGLRVIKGSGGHLWVRPLVNGQDVGWFLFDTGANGTVIDERVAATLGLPDLGAIDSTGIGGRTEARVRRVDSIELAGVRVRDVPIVSRDLSRSNLGVEAAGYLGVDLLAYGIIEYNERDVRVGFHVPSEYELPEGCAWVTMRVHNGKPAVDLEYEGHHGLFVIDTGAPGPMLVGPQAVERNQLLAGRETTDSYAWGSGGRVRAKRGSLDSVMWGGQRFDGVPATFITEDKGAGADTQRDGLIGANLLRRFVVVFDIEGERIAFGQLP